MARTRNPCHRLGIVLRFPHGRCRNLDCLKDFHASSIRAGVDNGPCRGDRPYKARASVPPAATVLVGRVRPFGVADPRHRTNPAARDRALRPRPRNPFAKVLEYLPDDKRLLVRAGVGWESEI